MKIDSPVDIILLPIVPVRRHRGLSFSIFVRTSFAKPGYDMDGPQDDIGVNEGCAVWQVNGWEADTLQWGRVCVVDVPPYPKKFEGHQRVVQEARGEFPDVRGIPMVNAQYASVEVRRLVRTVFIMWVGNHNIADV